MNILIVEDEELAAAKLERLINRYEQSYKIIGKLRSVEEAVSWFVDNPQPDLLFLDIHLLDGTCFDIIDEVDIKCPVIFTTAYEDYVFDSFQVHSIDYLIKPISFKRLQQSLDKFAGLANVAKPAAADYQQVITALKSVNKTFRNRFLVKFGSKLLPIGTDQVAFFLSKDRITFLVTFEGKKYPISATLDELEESIDPSLFFRINRQTILHVNSIKQVHKYFKGRLKVDLELDTEADIMVSSRRVSEFQDWLDR